MFLGEYEAALDAKNRVNFPAKLRDKIPEPDRRNLVLGCRPEGVLAIYTQAEFSRLASELDSKRGDEDQPDFERVLFTRAKDVEIDGAGRVLLPDDLRQWAGIEKHVVFAGVRNRIEVWDQGRWKAEQQKREEIFRKLGKSLLK